MYKTPLFWNEKNWISTILLPLSWIWYSVGLLLTSIKKSKKPPLKVSVPVICIGNFVMGGAGKTPTVLALVDTLKSLGHNPHILTRGFGGNFSETVLVETAAHSYKDVGDEALLLANTAPTWVGHDRSQSARQAINNGATILIMDDGLHNHSLNKDITFTVIDALQGIGNGRIFPAGPLRYSFKDSLDQTHAIIKIGKNSNILASKKPQFYAEITSIKQGQNKDILGFCGIGYPDKFKNTLKNLGYSVIKFQSFADHHPYTNSDLEGLIQEAQRLNVTLITTQKDWLRVPKKFQETVEVLPIQLKFNDEDELKKYIFDTLNLKMEQQI